MNTLSERINMKFGVVSDAHVMRNVNLGFAAYDTLCFICAELDVDLSDVTDSDFDSASIALDDFVKSANDDTGYTVSVWFN
jgi:DNA-binding Xre family transcriptional regulator